MMLISILKPWVVANALDVICDIPSAFVNDNFVYFNARNAEVRDCRTCWLHDKMVSNYFNHKQLIPSSDSVLSSIIFNIF